MSSRRRDRWPEVRAILERVQAVPAAERMALIERLCAEDRALRDEALAMLDHLDATDGFLEHAPLGGLLAAAVRAEELPAGASAVEPDGPAAVAGAGRVGRYRLIRRLGEGGMGIVYEAEQDQPHRLVALKILRAAQADGESLERFAREAETLARVRHPAVADIYEAGSEPDGTRWIAMELVVGRTLDAWLREERPELPRILRLFASLADGMHAAHVRGVIHRDLKASNILVEGDDAPRILDFGLARLREGEGPTGASESHAITRTGRIFGTLSAMSPEQACGKPDDVDARTDIYALGLLLYEALTGVPPYDIGSLPLPDAVAVIRDAIPRSPSSVARARPELSGDLDTIVMTALAKEPARRYQSAAALASDLRSWMAEEPIAARPPTTGYLLRMLLRRHRMLVRGSLAVAVVLLVALAALLVQNQALLSAQRGERQASERTGVLLYRSQVAHAEQLIESGRTHEARAVLERCAPARRGWEWHWLRGSIPSPVHAVPLGERRVLDLREVEFEGVVSFWALTADALGAEARPVGGAMPAALSPSTSVRSAAGQMIGGAILPGGDIVLAVRDERDRVLLERHGAEGVRWRLESGLEGVEGIEIDASGTLAAVTETTRDSSRLAAMDLLIVDCEIGRITARAPDIGFATALAWHASDPIVAVATIRRRLVTIDPVRGERSEMPLTTSIRAMVWPAAAPGPDGLLIAPTGNMIRALRSHEGGVWRGPLRNGVSGLAANGSSDASSLIAAASMGGELAVWRPDGRRALMTSVAGEGPTGVRLSACGTHVWSYRRGGAIECWSIDEDPRRSADPGATVAGGAASLAPRGDMFLRATAEGVTWIDARTLERLEGIGRAAFADAGAAVGPGEVGLGSMLALDAWTALVASGASLFVTRGGAVEPLVALDDPIESMALLAGRGDERIIVTVERSGRLRLWDAPMVADRRTPMMLAERTPTVVRDATVVAGRGDLLVVGDRAGDIHTFRLVLDRTDRNAPAASLERRGQATVSEHPVSVIALGDGGRIVFGDGVGTIGLAVATGRIWAVRAHDARVTGIAIGLAVGGGGPRVASASLDRSLRLWDAADGAALAVVDEGVDLLLGLAIDESGGAMLAFGADGPRRHAALASGHSWPPPVGEQGGDHSPSETTAGTGSDSTGW